jgi:hypothetical protein
MYSKSLGVKILSTNKRIVSSKTSIVTSILIAIVLVTGLSILSSTIQNVLANPCSHNSNAGNGGNGGFGDGNSNGPRNGGNGGNAAPVNCVFNGDVTTTEAPP